MDNLVCLDFCFVKEGFLNGEHVLSIFFDVDKAYDTTWKYVVMKDIFDIEPFVNKNFLSETKHLKSEWGVPV